jgi:hypothetical protein
MYPGDFGGHPSETEKILRASRQEEENLELSFAYI